MAYSSYAPSGQEKLFYFTGKVRAFWKDQVFFLDQRNAAIVGFENLYINGERACQADLHRLDAQVASCDWESAPVFNSYVVKYNASEAPPWPYKLKGKKLWLARFAWTGYMPLIVEEQLQGLNVVYMPLTYYTGKLINLFDDKALYGDYRNNVMVHLSDLYVFGQRADYGNAMMHFDQHVPIIHSFVASLNYLTSKKYEGPEPHLPTWPIDEYGPSTWVAKFAWQGEMPEEFRQQLSQFNIIKITEWDRSRDGDYYSPRGGYMQESSFSVAESAKGRDRGATFIPKPLLATTQKEAAIVKGSMLLANHKFGLINSYLDVVVFGTKNFYVNGEVFREGTALDEFFQDRKVPVTAWIVPLKEPVLVFDVYVMWRAVCVWYGIPPKNMETIKKRYDNGNIAGSVPEALNTTSDNRYTLVMGEIVNVSYNNGFAKAKVGNRLIDITFKRKAVYMNGYKLHTKCTLTEIRPALESGSWYMLVYPLAIGNQESEVNYTALALWQYQYQHYISGDLLFRILLEGGNVTLENGLPETESGNEPGEDKGIHMTGYIVKTTPSYGIIQTQSVTIEPAYIFFLRSDFYVDGLTPEGNQLLSVDRNRQVNLLARSTKHQDIKDFPISMYATLVWMGRKPHLEKPDSTGSQSLTSAESDGAANGNTEDSSSDSPDIESPKDLSTDGGTFQKALDKTKPSSPVIEHLLGKFVYLKDRYGVIRNGSKLTRYNSVLCDYSVVWVDGDRLCPDESLCNSIMREEIQCNVLAYEIPEVKVGSHRVTMQATVVWLGKKPFHVVIPELKCPLKVMEMLDRRVKDKSEMKSIPKKIKEYVEKSDRRKTSPVEDDESKGILERLAKVSLEDSDGESSSPASQQENIVIDPKKPYVGRHVSGRITKVLDGSGIAVWRWKNKGEVFLLFNKKNLYVNLCPMDDNYTMTQTKSCNFFVIPTRHKTVEGYRVSLYATCGWIGSKPHDIPSPGEQDHAHISLDKAHAVDVKNGKNVSGFIVKMMKTTGIASWRSIGHGGDIYIEFEKELVCDTLQPLFGKNLKPEVMTRSCHFYVRPIEQKVLGGYTVSLSAICGWMGKKPAHFPKIRNDLQPTLLVEKLHVTPVDQALLEKTTSIHSRDSLEQPSPSKDKGSISALDNVSCDTKESSDGKKKKKNKLEDWNDEETPTDLEGKIVELHSNVGRLQGTDDIQHFFSRENSYLYGVCLSSVELWHVLVQDEAVTYRLTEITGQAKVSKMWIGLEEIDANKAEVLINEWCSKNLVPDASRDLLIQQLEMKKGDDSATKEE